MGIESLFSSVQFGSFVGMGYSIITYGAVILALAGLGYFIYWIMRYNIPILGLEVVGDAIKIFKDRGALIKDKSGKFYQFRLLKKRVDLPVPAADAYVFAKGNKKCVMVSQISPTDFRYVKVSKDITHNEISLVPIDQDVLNWYANTMERQNDKYQKEMKWYQNPAMIGLGTLVICLIILIITFKYAGGWQETAKATAVSIMQESKGMIGQVVS